MGALVTAVGSIFGGNNVPKPPTPTPPPPIAPPLVPTAPPSPNDPATGAAMAAAGRAAISGFQNPNAGYQPFSVGAGSLASKALLADDGAGGGQSVYGRSQAAKKLMVNPDAPAAPAATPPAPAKAATAVANAPSGPPAFQEQNGSRPARGPGDNGLLQYNVPFYGSEEDRQKLVAGQNQVRTPPAGSAFFTPWVSSPRR